ncbi:MAG: YebC/PmpR family DNA-binding transcriptional regulator [Ignavibacteriales bacterium]|nr:YebC/PmpR family DNA-binding transcriptional regulator [Ignavibacteriales bacterium]
MSGHSKWATIKRKKAVTDAKRGKAFTRVLREITIAARDGGGDLNANPRLRLAVDNAKGQNMPAENIERAIKKATGELEGQVLHEIVYEGYGPGGIAILIEVVTDNKNRSVAEVRHVFSKYGGSMGESGSVAWMFERKGVVTILRENKPEDELMEIALEAGADDFQVDEEYCIVQTSMEDFETVRKMLADKALHIENASLQWLPKNSIAVTGEDAIKLVKVLDMLDEVDDIQNVYNNADIDPAAYE